MKVNSTWAMVDVDPKNMIFFIEDICDKTGSMSITNDAENVCNYFWQTHSAAWRIVYKDTDGEWWEIVRNTALGWTSGDTVGFKRWNGLAWDILQR